MNSSKGHAPRPRWFVVRTSARVWLLLILLCLGLAACQDQVTPAGPAAAPPARARAAVVSSGDPSTSARHAIQQASALPPTPTAAATSAGGSLLATGSQAVRSLAVPITTPTPPAGVSAGPTASAAKAPSAPPPVKQTYLRNDILARLKTELANRKVAWQDPGIQLIPADRVVVTGKVKGPSGMLPTQVTLQIGVAADGKPQVTARQLTGGAEQLRSALETALTRRVDEANQALPGEVPVGRKLQRLYVRDAETLVAQLTGGATGDDAAAGPPWPTPTIRPAHPPERGSMMIPHTLPPITRDHSSLVGGFMRPDSVTPVPPERRPAPPLETTPAGASP